MQSVGSARIQTDLELRHLILICIKMLDIEKTANVQIKRSLQKT
jgi:hypothetical protein